MFCDLFGYLNMNGKQFVGIERNILAIGKIELRISIRIDICLDWTKPNYKLDKQINFCSVLGKHYNNKNFFGTLYQFLIYHCAHTLRSISKILKLR